MGKPDPRSIFISFLLVALVHRAGAQTSRVHPIAAPRPSREYSHAPSPDDATAYVAMLRGEAWYGRSLPDRPVSASRKAQQGAPAPVGGLGSVAAGGVGAGVGIPGGTPPFDTSRVNMTMLQRQFEQGLSPLEDPAISVSKLDLKAPGKARKEYEKAFRFLNKKDYQNAAEHLTQAVSIYPDFVAAHNALGFSYLGLRQDERARDEFAKAAVLDDHLPISHLNLGCAELALKHYAEAETAVQKASAIAPLDLQVLTALAYAQLLNHNYSGAIATAHQVHSRSHKDVAIIHYYGAAAWNGLNNPKEVQGELQTLLKEDPKSPAAPEAVGILRQIKEQEEKQTVASLSLNTSIEVVPPAAPTGPVEMSPSSRKFLQDANEARQIAEAEALCEGCELASASQPVEAAGNVDTHDGSMSSGSAWTLHKDVDEVSVFFAATDHGKAVSDLALADVAVLDNHKEPLSVLGFRSEAQLPLRLGLVIDTSESVTSRFSFEQSAAVNFVRKVVSGTTDLAFVVGFSNPVLLVQDFTADNSKLSEAINKLAPGGGTALWDAVAFAAEKLASRRETQPVARVLVVISDGEDNSSSTTLKQAIAVAENGEVTVYTVSTREDHVNTAVLPKIEAQLGDRALTTLANLSGGSAFFPGSLRHLDHSLDDLQEFIRSRYMISYRPALFKRDGHYRAIEITAQKSGRKLRVHARKGYYAQASSSGGKF